MTAKREIDDWIAGYVQAWNSNDPDDIGRLFTKSALYFTGPFESASSADGLPTSGPDWRTATSG